MYRLRVECTITFACPARCDHCNKAVGYADFPDTDMTPAQMRKAVEQAHEQDVAISRITLTGGEPVVHPQLQQLAEEASQFKRGRGDAGPIGRVLSNGMRKLEKRREKIKLPPSFSWVVTPLDDVDDPYSGKNDPSKRPGNRYMNGLTGGGMVHMPFWISPADLGMHACWEQCDVRGWCGKGLDSSGWSMCGKAGMFGRLLGIDPHMPAGGDIVRHVNTPIPEICRHCQYGLPREDQEKIAADYFAGRIEDAPDGVSRTFRDAFERQKHDRTTFPRMPEVVPVTLMEESV